MNCLQNSIVFLLVLCCCESTAYSDDPSGFTDWFNQNTDEFQNKPLTFTEPIPKWIKGTMIRNGGALHHIGNRKTTHIFDSLAKLHSFKFHGNGSVSFSAKFIQSEYYNKSIASNTIATYLQMDVLDPPFNELEVVEAFMHNMDNTNVNVYRIYNKDIKQYEYMTMTDMWKVYKIDQNLATKFSITPKKQLSDFLYVAGAESSAHPIKEYGKENYFEFLTSISKIKNVKSKMTLYRMTTVADREKVVMWDIDEVRYIHSFAVTKNYVVIVAPPITIDNIKMITKGNVLDAMVWSEKDPVLIYLIDINSGEVKTLKSKPLFFFHHISAYEQDNTIIVDVCTFDNSTTVKMYEFPTLFDPKARNSVQFGNDLKRLVIDIDTLSVETKGFPFSPKVPYSNRIDFPIINENFRYVKYCYVYGVAQKIDNINFDRFAIVKKDLCNPIGDKSWTMDNNFPSETLFVPTPGSTREDDGILLSHVFDGILKQTNLFLINATTMQTISKSKLPTNIPMAFHGRFFLDI